MSRKERKTEIKCDVFSKIVGYCRKLDNFNEGKKQEFLDRNLVDLTKIPSEIES
jgi:anaerobic ribonucleoside-triphosphate reductase